MRGGIPIFPGVEVNLLIHFEAAQFFHNPVHISVVVLPIPIHIDLDFFEDESVERNDAHLIVRTVFLELLASLFDDFLCVCHIPVPFGYITKIVIFHDINISVAQSGQPMIRKNTRISRRRCFNVTKRKLEFAVVLEFLNVLGLQLLFSLGD